VPDAPTHDAASADAGSAVRDGARRSPSNGGAHDANLVPRPDATAQAEGSATLTLGARGQRSTSTTCCKRSCCEFKVTPGHHECASC
jgi:hypothetical protein